jgi:hypothetical protein
MDGGKGFFQETTGRPQILDYEVPEVFRDGQVVLWYGDGWGGVT